jgi:hypothetical protein
MIEMDFERDYQRASERVSMTGSETEFAKASMTV